MDKSAIDTPSREIDLRNIPVHLRTALRRALEFEARAPAPRSAEEAEQCEEQLRAIADEFFGALLTPVLQRAVRSAAVGDAASALVRHLPRRMRSDGLETVNVRTSRGTTVPVTTPYYREKHARRAKRRPGLYPALVVLGIYEVNTMDAAGLQALYIDELRRSLVPPIHPMVNGRQTETLIRRAECEAAAACTAADAVTWVWSDLHLGHEHSRSAFGRPFRTAAEADRAMMEAWYDQVAEGETIICLGDVTVDCEALAHHQPKFTNHKTKPI